eukprot:632322-Amorphochlora_amoeboformis.AAC.1
MQRELGLARMRLGRGLGLALELKLGLWLELGFGLLGLGLVPIGRRGLGSRKYLGQETRRRRTKTFGWGE